MVSFALKAPLTTAFVTEGWPMRRAGRPFHGGLDLRAPVGTPVYAAANGKIVFVGEYSDTPGIAVELDHGDGMLTRYLHLSKASVSVGQPVMRGQQLGLSGHAASDHLHFDAFIKPSQVYEYTQKFGTPKGIGQVTYKDRTKIPSEPLFPATYQQDVIDAARAWNVSLYKPSLGSNLVVLLLMGVTGYFVYRYIKRTSSSEIVA